MRVERGIMKGTVVRAMARSLSLGIVLGLAACGGGSGGDTSSLSAQKAESCMQCHNASLKNNYSGPGIENPHPFPGADKLLCTTCHGGDPKGDTPELAHVPPPPEIGDEANLTGNATAFFNRLTLTGIDKFPDYTVDGTDYTAIDYLQFINPGDLRVINEGRSCGQCHANHVEDVSSSLLATSAGVLSGAMYAAGVDNALADTSYEDTAADLGFRAVIDPSFAGTEIGSIASLLEFPVYSVRNANNIKDNNDYQAASLADDVDPITGRVITGSPLADLYHEQVAFTCGDCHLGSAGANNRSGDYRSSGCTACHMPYSLGGRSYSTDPNVNKTEPADPDDIDPPERSHPRTHQIASVARTLSNGKTVAGIDDYACAGCHQGSNRTVMQYWGIRLDQNADVRNNRQYPANPDSYLRTTNDTRLFDPLVGNNEFNGRNHNQYLLEEDYDGDGLDDTPEDIHYQAGLGCIDCHGSYDLHGGDVTLSGSELMSRMEQAVAITCESCHGDADSYAPRTTGTRYDGTSATMAADSKGNALRNVIEEGGDLFLYSRVTGQRHYVSQTRDVVVDSGKLNPITNQPIYTDKGSYAMGTWDGNASSGHGPEQLADSGTPTGFSHMRNMDCASCHSSWTNTCMGCHLEGEFNQGNNFSNITGDRIVFNEENADFVYQSPVFFQLGVDEKNKITQYSPNTKMFFKYKDQGLLTGGTPTFSDVFAFSDRNEKGNNPGGAAPELPSMSHNSMLAHSIRGRVDQPGGREGPRYCVSCHLTTDSTDATWRPKYDAFRTAIRTQNFAALDFPELRDEIGLNTGNQNNTPFFVHQVAGLGSGLFLFDENGCAVNGLDNFAGRKGCTVAPSANPNPAALNLDRIVDETGRELGSNNHPMVSNGSGDNLRLGAGDPAMTGPLGADLLNLLTDPDTGLVLDSWLDADSAKQGGAGTILP